jgi:hypothetical protein
MKYLTLLLNNFFVNSTSTKSAFQMRVGIIILIALFTYFYINNYYPTREAWGTLNYDAKTVIPALTPAQLAYIQKITDEIAKNKDKALADAARIQQAAAAAAARIQQAHVRANTGEKITAVRPLQIPNTPRSPISYLDLRVWGRTIPPLTFSQPLIVRNNGRRR